MLLFSPCLLSLAVCLIVRMVLSRSFCMVVACHCCWVLALSVWGALRVALLCVHSVLCGFVSPSWFCTVMDLLHLLVWLFLPALLVCVALIRLFCTRMVCPRLVGCVQADACVAKWFALFLWAVVSPPVALMLCVFVVRFNPEVVVVCADRGVWCLEFVDLWLRPCLALVAFGCCLALPVVWMLPLSGRHVPCGFPFLCVGSPGRGFALLHTWLNCGLMGSSFRAHRITLPSFWRVTSVLP